MTRTRRTRKQIEDDNAALVADVQTPSVTLDIADVENDTKLGATRNPRPTQNGKKIDLQERKARLSGDTGGVLNVPKHIMKEGYRYYWAIDLPGEIEKLLYRDYEFVKDDAGSKLNVPAGNGNYHFLMRIPQEYFDQDMQEQSDRIQEATFQQAKVGAGQYTVGMQGKEGEGVAIRRERDLI